MFVGLSDLLRTHSERILTNIFEVRARKAMEDLLGTYVRWLDDCSIALTPQSFARWSFERTYGNGYTHKLLGVHGRYKTHYLVQVLIFTFYVRGVHKGFASVPLAHLIKQATRTLPPSVQGFVDQLIGGAIMPSASTLPR